MRFCHPAMLLAAILALAGCGERPSAGSRAQPTATPVKPEPMPPQPPPPPALQCDLPSVDPSSPPDCTRVGALIPIRGMSHPDRAIEVDLRLEDGCGRTLPSEYAVCLDAPGSVLSPREYDSAITLLLLAPPASAEEAAILPVAIDAFVAARPAGERIAIQRLDAELAQIADFTDDPARLARQLLAGLDTAGSAVFAATTTDPVDAAEMLQDARSLASRVGGVSSLSRRAVVVIAPNQPAPPLPTQVTSVLWVDAPVTELPEAARRAAGMLDVVDAAGAVGLGTCETAVASVHAPEGPLQHAFVPLDASLPETLSGSCDPAAAAAAAEGSRMPLQRVYFSFTAAQRATYRSRDSAVSREDFFLSVQLGDEVAPVAAKAHFRGQGSLHCERRNYNVDLDGNDPRHVVPGLASDEFLLISMCLDDAYSKQVTGIGLAGSLGLVPYASKVVELVLDGESRGIYLLIGKPKEQLRLKHARPAVLLRRGNDATGSSPELEYAAPGTDPLHAYEALLEDAETRAGTGLLRALDRRADVDQVLRWVALNSLLENGDYVDEVWFLGTEARGAPGRTFFTISAWDMDDLFSSCHGGGGDAMHDPRGLAYCVEGRLETAILRDPAGYERYVAALEEVIGRVSPAEFHAAVERTADDILPFLADPAVRAASEELGRPSTQAEAEREIRDELAGMEQAFLARRAALLARIAAYRAGPAEGTSPAP